MMETALCLIEANEPIYPIEILRNMRNQRAMLIQTSQQFKFVCDTIYKVYKQGLVKPLKQFRNPSSGVNGVASVPSTGDETSSPASVVINGNTNISKS